MRSSQKFLAGIFDEQVNFAGESCQPGLPVEATYEFNSWRLGYRWKFKDGEQFEPK